MLRATITAILCLLAAGANAEEWTAKVSRVIDGDTFQLSRPLVRIRLCGVDTPEKGQRGYREATQFTKRLVAGKDVRCRTVGEGTPCDGRSRKKSGERFVAQCFVDGEVIAMELVEAGLACALPRYSGLHYVGNVSGIHLDQIHPHGLVIGAGVMGASIALKLSKTTDKRVILLDRKPPLGGMSGRTFGQIRLHYSSELMLKMAARGVEFFRDWETEVGFGDAGYVPIQVAL